MSKGIEEILKREIIELWVYYPYPTKRCFSFEFLEGHLWKCCPEFINWRRFSYDDFAKAVIEQFGYCWKMIFINFDGEKWQRGFTAINWS